MNPRITILLVLVVSTGCTATTSPSAENTMSTEEAECLSVCEPASGCSSATDSPSIYDAGAHYCIDTPWGRFECPDPYVQCQAADGGTSIWTAGN
jgi:hypothetical protein